jgi:hypothetical protein
MEILITFKGNIPSKKNSKQIYVNRNTGRRFITSSDKFKTWHETQTRALTRILPKLNHQQIKAIRFKYFPGSKHKGDLSNKFESVMDFLVDREVIEDDNYFVISKCILEFGGIDKKNPRGELVIVT